MMLRRYHDENGRGEGVTTAGDVNPDSEQATAEPKRKRSAKSDDKSGD